MCLTQKIPKPIKTDMSSLNKKKVEILLEKENPPTQSALLTSESKNRDTAKPAASPINKKSTPTKAP